MSRPFCAIITGYLSTAQSGDRNIVESILARYVKNMDDTLIFADISEAIVIRFISVGSPARSVASASVIGCRTKHADGWLER